MFRNWYQSRESYWNSVGIYIDSFTVSSHDTQWHLKVSSDYGLGGINLYERNGVWWIDFEAVSFDYDCMFSRVNIAYKSETDIAKEELEFIEYLTYES